jgi:tRNA/tmRNA/rRNA uracil-C5-methylase (TrmA/RlmC/RlmD family)
MSLPDALPPDDRFPEIALVRMRPDGQAEGVDGRGDTWVVADGIPGDIVEVQPTAHSRHARTHFGLPRRWLESSPDRVPSPCVHAGLQPGRCSGCPLMPMRPEAQRAWKSEVLRSAAAGLGTPEVEVRAVGPDHGYRNRAQWVWRHAAHRGALLGAPSLRSHAVAPVDGCLVLHPALAAVHGWLQPVLQRRAIPPDRAHDGLRWVSARTTPQGRVHLELLGRTPDPAWLERLVAACRGRDEVQGISWGWRAAADNVVRPEEGWSTVLGQPDLVFRVGPLDVRLRPGRFFQLHYSGLSAMMAFVAAHAGTAAVIWDLYGGTGVLGLVAAGPGTREIRVLDSHPGSPGDARRHDGPTPDVILQAIDLAGFEPPPRVPPPDLVVVDPPRRGLDPAVLRWLCHHDVCAAGRLIYLSCHPETWARDVAALAGAGWTLRRVEGWDMLPGTTHIELGSVLTREPVTPAQSPA